MPRAVVRLEPGTSIVVKLKAETPDAEAISAAATPITEIALRSWTRLLLTMVMDSLLWAPGPPPPPAGTLPGRVWPGQTTRQYGQGTRAARARAPGWQTLVPESWGKCQPLLRPLQPCREPGQPPPPPPEIGDWTPPPRAPESPPLLCPLG